MKHDKTLELINNAIEEKNKRDYKQRTISGGIIGHSCDAYLWYLFRHCHNKNIKIDAKSQRRFDDGHATEDLSAQRWKDAGIQLQTHDYETGKQIQVNTLGGWFKGLLDGIIHGGIPGRETEKFVWEAKATEKAPSKKHFEDEDTLIKNWNYKYYAQAQTYMGLSGIHRHVTTINKPGGRDEILVETPYSESDCNNLIARAGRIIASDEPMIKVSDNPTYYECGYCDMSDVCHKGYMPKPNCRNCAYVTFHTDGNQRATCGKHNKDFSAVEDMDQYYPCHRFNPKLLSGDLLGIDDNGSVKYRIEGGSEYANGEGEGEFTSIELYNVGNDLLLKDDVFVSIKQSFGGRVMGENEGF